MPVGVVDDAGMKCKSHIASVVVQTYKLSSRSVNIRCFDSMVVGITPVHNAGCIIQRGTYYTKIEILGLLKLYKT